MPVDKIEPEPVPRASQDWVTLHVPVPRQWREWLKEAAFARGVSMTALVRMLIRNLMIERHEQ